MIGEVAERGVGAERQEQLDHLESAPGGGVMKNCPIHARPRHHSVDVDAEADNQADAVVVLQLHGAMQHVHPAVMAEPFKQRGVSGEPRTHLVVPASDTGEREGLEWAELDLGRAVLEQVVTNLVVTGAHGLFVRRAASTPTAGVDVDTVLDKQVHAFEEPVLRRRAELDDEQTRRIEERIV